MAEMQVKEKRPGLHKALFGPFKLMRIEGKANIVGLAGGNPGKCESEVSSITKSELVDLVDQVTGILEDAYSPESSREDLASAIGDALDALEGNDDDEDEDTDDDDYADSGAA